MGLAFPNWSFNIKMTTFLFWFSINHEPTHKLHKGEDQDKLDQKSIDLALQTKR